MAELYQGTERIAVIKNRINQQIKRIESEEFEKRPKTIDEMIKDKYFIDFVREILLILKNKDVKDRNQNPDIITKGIFMIGCMKQVNYIPNTSSKISLIFGVRKVHFLPK